MIFSGLKNTLAYSSARVVVENGGINSGFFVRVLLRSNIRTIK
jgi:hypothetical protein